MPPPKKPKNGPTSVEQFLSREELQRMEETAAGVAPAATTSAGSSATLPAQTDAKKSSGGGGGGGGGGDGDEGGGHKKSKPASSSSSSSSSSSAAGVKGAVTSPVPGSGVESSDTRFRLLRQLFARQDPDSDRGAPAAPPALPAAPRAAHRKNRNGERSSGALTEPGAGGATSQEAWPSRRGGGKLTSGDRASPGGPHPPRSASTRGGGLSGEESKLSANVLMERTYLTSLIKDSPPASSAGVMAATPYLERVALNSGKLLHGLMGAPAPPTYIHAAFQLPLMDTSTSGPALTGPLSTSVLAYLAAQGTHHHPHSPLPPLPPLPPCCVSSSLPLVDAAGTSPSTSSSSSFPSSLTIAASALNEPFDLSVKKLSRSGGSVGGDSTGSDRPQGDPASSSRPGSSAGELSTGSLPSASLGASANNNNSNTSASASPAVAGTPPARGERDGGSSSPALPRGLTPATYLTDRRGPPGLAASPLGKLFAHDVTAGPGMGGPVAQRPFPATAHTSPGDSVSLNRSAHSPPLGVFSFSLPFFFFLFL